MHKTRKAAIGYFAIFLFLLLLLVEGEALSEGLKKALALCADSLIPSLFPYLVLSELIVTSGLGERLGRLFSGVSKRLFGISGAGTSAIILGALCGFPVGAKCAVLLYEKGRLSKVETERLLCFCNNTGAGFLVAGVGASFFKNAGLGLLLYSAQILSAVMIGAGIARLFGRHTSADEVVNTPSFFGARLFTEAISSASRSMLYVCGYIVFFSSVTGGISGMLSRITDSRIPRVFISGILEISSGCRACAELFEEGMSFISCAALCAFFVGWSGLSVHAQTASICKEYGISLAPYMGAKILQGILCAAFVSIYIALNKGELSVFAPVLDTDTKLRTLFGFAMNFIFIFALLKKLIKKCSKTGKFVI